MKFLLDMNISPQWVSAFIKHGFSATHWSDVGDPRASDATIIDYALSNNFVVFTHDLDFGVTLALTQSRGPSVVQLRDQAILPHTCASSVLSLLKSYSKQLMKGALISIDKSNHRMRMLPLQ